jgi:hypothetical protein
LKDFQRIFRTLRDIFRDTPPAKTPEIRKIFAIGRVLEGEHINAVCAELKVQRYRIDRLAKELGKRGLMGLVSYEELTKEPVLADRRLGIAQMLLGALAERRFEELSDQITGPGVLRIEDHRPSRTDTDYRLLNGHGNPICRFNIKFHGTLFRDAKRYVKLEPEDCFALATYKINNALKRQEEERLPYAFLVLSVPELSAPEVARLVPADYVWTLAVLRGRRLVEEAIVERLRAADYHERFQSIFQKMPEGKFRIISARKAHNLLHEKLFERVHALSLKGFTRRFRNAEVDMHFSLSRELTPVRTFFELLIKESPQRVAVGLDRGDY